MYITDWFATLLHMAGLRKLTPANVDSYNMWKMISRWRQ